jgi:16S rRNA (guanine527-N7)-methyltransferase
MTPLQVSSEEIGCLARQIVAEHLTSLDFQPPSLFLERIERFAAMLALWGRRSNLTAAPDDSAELAFHIVDSLMPLVIASRPDAAVLHGSFVASQTVLDLGSGAGFPGLILAAASPSRFVLLESRRKRASFLRIAANEMGLSNVEVDAIWCHPDDLTPSYDVVIGRAFAQPAQFYASASAALRPHGLAVLYATPAQPLDLEAAAAVGLYDHLRLPYEVRRNDRPISRILGLWRKLSDG